MADAIDTGEDMRDKVTVTIERQEPVPPPPTKVVIEMPEDVAQGLVNILSKVSTLGKLGQLSYEVYTGLTRAGIRPKGYINAKLHTSLNLIEFLDD